MARITYADRLKALIANPAMSARDCQFANSLLSYYVKRKSLTSGRARCVRELEARGLDFCCAHLCSGVCPRVPGL